MERLLTLYSEVQSTDVRWLWYPFIAIGKITLLQGDPGDGKSTMMMNLIAELSTGGKTPDVELLYHPILQVVILRKSNRDASTAIHWGNKDKICSSFSSRAFSGVIFEAMNWKWSCRYQCRGICRGEENAKFLIFELDESRILIRKNQYQIFRNSLKMYNDRAVRLLRKEC